MSADLANYEATTRKRWARATAVENNVAILCGTVCGRGGENISEIMRKSPSVCETP